MIILSVILIAFFATAIVFFENRRSANVIYHGNTDLEQFSYMNTSQNEYNYNFNEESLVYVYNEHIFVSKYDGIYIYQKDEEEKRIVDEFDCRYLYVNDQGLYYVAAHILK